MKQNNPQQEFNTEDNLFDQDTRAITKNYSAIELDQKTTKTDHRIKDDLIKNHDEEGVYHDDLNEKDLLKKKKVIDDKIEPIVYQWTSIVKILELFKFLNVALICALLVSSASIFYLINRPFLAYDRSDMLVKEVKTLSMQPLDLKHFIHKFVEKRYTWTEFDPQKLVYDLRPMITKRFSKDLLKFLGKDKANNKEGESLEQYVTRIKAIVTDKSSYAVFDRILRVNDIPIIVPVQLQLNIIQGRKTRFNPFGFYVDKITEFSK